MSTGKFIFLLPAYKARYLEEALRSILAQTYTNFQVLVSDDASLEPIGDIVRRFDDSRITYRRNLQNLGASKLTDHWNLLLELSQTEYVIVASDDDVYAPTFLEQIDRLTITYPNADLFRVPVEVINENGESVRKEIKKKRFYSTPDFIRHLLSQDGVLCVGNYVMRSSSLKQMGGFISFPLAWKADTATLLGLSCHGVAATEDILFSFRMSGINISSQSGRRASVDRQKIKASLLFYTWMNTHLDAAVFAQYDAIVKNKLEGEMRTYYWSLSFKEFVRLYRQLVEENWFISFRNRASFVWGWVRQKMVCGSPSK